MQQPTTYTHPSGHEVVPGTVLTFTEDLSFIDRRWRDRRPGVHFVVTGYSSSGYMLHVHNTYTGQPHELLADSLLDRCTRVIGQMPWTDEFFAATVRDPLDGQLRYAPTYIDGEDDDQ